MPVGLFEHRDEELGVHQRELPRVELEVVDRDPVEVDLKVEPEAERQVGGDERAPGPEREVAGDAGRRAEEGEGVPEGLRPLEGLEDPAARPSERHERGDEVAVSTEELERDGEAHREADHQSSSNAGVVEDLGRIVREGRHRQMPRAGRLCGEAMAAVVEQDDPPALGELWDDPSKGPPRAADPVEDQEGGPPVVSGAEGLVRDRRAVPQVHKRSFPWERRSARSLVLRDLMGDRRARHSR